ncbi:hypothetical protein [uncultured Rikenella sp.]|uniref:hypothetical protein n=1 Tax=uncultured Rikenella sp. TaxID=368003 RepID=UPI0025DF2079|nr:hypothetical protein [uncultured Rikenella sp.]
MKKLTKILLVAGGAALICGASVMTYLKAQTPMSAQDELTLANLEALAVLPPFGPDLGGWGIGGEAGRIECYNVLYYAGMGRITVTKCSTCTEETCSDYTSRAKCRK